MHGVVSLSELDAILSENGAIQAALEAKKAGKVRFIGISMHVWPGPLIEALHRWNFDAVMSTINYYDHFNYPEIETELLPLAQQKGAGVILMKPIADVTSINLRLKFSVMLQPTGFGGCHRHQ